MNKLIVSVLSVLLAFAGRSDDFAKYVEITTTYAGGEVVDFPVLVKITSSTPVGFYTDVKNAGADLKFTDDTGAGDYPFEVDTWNASGDSYIWVKLPRLSAGLTFRMYYGNAEKTAPTTPTAVWSGYDLVCHVGGNANDSTANAHEGKLNPDGKDKTDGPVGQAYGTEVSNAGAAMMNKIYDGTAGYLANDSFSYSFWVRANAAWASWSSLVGPKVANNTDAWGINVANEKALAVGAAQNKQATITIVSDGKAFPIDVWRKVDVTMEGENATLYVDGVKINAGPMSSKPKISWVKYMAWAGLVGWNDWEFGTGNSVAADIDECRISKSTADANRVAADYQTVANVATFLSFSEPKEPGSVVPVLPQGVIVH